MNSELLKVIENEAEAERQRILESGQKEAREILEKAQTEALQLEQKFEADSLAQEKAEMAKAESTANLQAMAILLAKKSRTIEQIFEETYQKILETPPDKYKKALKIMIQEAAGELSGDLVIKSSSDDLKTVQEIAKALKLKSEVKADPLIKEGVIVSNQAESNSILNRFSDRLKKARPSLMARISEILWG